MEKQKQIAYKMRKVNMLLIILLHIGESLLSQSHPSPHSYVAYKTSGGINIDGKGNEESWQKADYSEDFIDIEGENEPKYQTGIKMLYDNNYLYFYAKMEEPHVWGTLKQRDTVIFYNNDFEIFIDPDGDTHNYYEFEMNALNTIWDLLIVKPYRESAPVLDSWDIQGLKSAVYVEGTLNDPSDVDSYWSLEVAIPWEVLKEANVHKRIPEDEFWRINFSRVHWDHNIHDGTYSRKKDEQGIYLPEYNWVWSPQYVVNMHEPEKWGYVFFSSKEVGGEDKFVIPDDEQIKWWMYDLYRAQKTYFRKNKKWAPGLEALPSSKLLIGEHELKPTYEPHSSGWNISVESPFSGKTLLIKEDGKFVKP